jgi:predicted ABC-type ATPase
MVRKVIEIISGPNGSGKSTFAETLFSKRNTKGKKNYFINPDILAAGLSFSNNEVTAFHAGRLMLQSVKEFVKNGESFAFESTLSGKTWLKFLQAAIHSGYDIRIYFIYLDRVSENIKRVKNRVQQGGHSVPVDAIRRRYPKSFYNFWNKYRPLANEWFIFNNSNSIPKLIHSSRTFEQLTVSEQDRFVRDFLKGKQNGSV